MIRSEPNPNLPAPADTFKLTPTGIVVTGKPSLDECLGYAGQLIYMVGMAPIAIADVYLYVEKHFGDAEAASMVPAIGRTKHTIQNWLSIVRQFPHSRRREGLEIGHYDAVAGIKTSDGVADVKKQDALLARAVSEQWTIGKTREEVQRVMGPKKTKLSSQTPEDEKTAGGCSNDSNEDTAVMDATPTGAAMKAEERHEVLTALSEQKLSTANQRLLAVIATLKAMRTDPDFLKAIDPEGLNPDAIRLEAQWLINTAGEVSALQTINWNRSSARKAAPAKAGAEGEGDGDSAPRTPSPVISTTEEPEIPPGLDRRRKAEA